MRETRSSGSVEGVMSNRDPYSDFRQIQHSCYDTCESFSMSAWFSNSRPTTRAYESWPVAH